MTQIYCSNCGKLIRSSSNFCQFCGKPQHGTEAMTEKLTARKTTHHDDRDNTQNSNTKQGKQRTIEKKRLCQRALWSFFVNYLGKTSLLLLIFLVGTVFEPLFMGPLLVLYVLALYVSAAIVRHNYFFEVNQSSFRKEHGVIHKTDVTIPFNRIQNVNITRSLSDRMLGLARVDIESAGSSSVTRRNVAGGSQTKAEGHLPGVTMSQAEEIHDLLLERFGGLQEFNHESNP